MNKFLHLSRRKRLIGYGILLAIVFWLVESAVEALIFNDPFYDSFFAPSFHELWMRGIAIVFLILFAVISRILITKKKHAEARANHLNKVLRAVRNVNQLITMENNEDQLIKKSCQLLTEGRGYNGAIIFLVDEQGRFIKLEESGWSDKRPALEDQLKNEKFTECSQRAFNHSGVILIENTMKECKGCALLGDEINSRSLTCRMEHEGTVYGILSVNLPTHYAALKEEQDLVEEMAGDLAYAIHKIRLKDKLKETENHYQLLAENARDIILIHDLNGKIQYINSAGILALGKTKKEILGTGVEDYIHSSDEMIPRKEKRLEGDKSKYIYETYYLNSQGKKVPVEVNSAPVVQNGKTEGVLIIARDIKERKDSEERIQRFINDLQIIYEVTSSLLKTETQDEILDLMGERIYTLNPSSYIVLSAVDTSDPDTIWIRKYYGDKEKIKEAIEKLGIYPENIPVRISEMTEQHKQGLESGNFSLIEGGIHELLDRTISEDRCRMAEEHLEVDKIYFMGMYYKGEPKGRVTIMLKEGINLNKQTLIENIINQASVALSQKHSESALRSAKEKAEESDRLKSAFLMNLSHEVRTPLNGIMGFSQILQEREFPHQRQSEFLGIIHNKAGQLLNILNNILDLSKIEAEQLRLGKDDFYLNDVLYELYDAYSLELEKNEKNNILLNLHCDLKRTECRLYTDQNRLKQILNNLISNAIKFTSEGTVEFGYQLKDPKTLLFYIKDTGIGIPEEKQETIFKSFRQADNSTSRDYEGTGLGLSLAKSLVELFGGKLWVESKTEEGSCFYFTIPYKKYLYKKEESKGGSFGKIYSWAGKKVLIVEDDPVSLEFMKEIVSGTKAEIITAQNGTEGLLRFRETEDLSLILMDIRLPDISGLEVTKKIRSQHSSIPIIAQTAYTMDNDAKKCLDAGCDDYLTKPVDIKTLMNVINKHFKKQKSL
jgi:PAS domain S-box-containing protein